MDVVLVVEGNPLLFVGLFGMIGLLLVFFGFRNAKQRMVIRDYPTSRIRSMAMGPVEVKGDAESVGRTLTTPLTRKDCLGYRYKIEEERTRTDSEGNTRTEWVTIKDITRTVPFYVDDGTGRVLVDADRADVSLKQSHQVRSDKIEKGLLYRLYEWVRGLFGYEPTERYPEIPRETLEELKDSWKPRRHSEYSIGVGESVYVFGEAVRTEDAEWMDDPETDGSPGAGGLFDAIPWVGGDDAGWGSGQTVVEEVPDDTEDFEVEDAGTAERESVFERLAEIRGGSMDADDVLREEDVVISRMEDTPMFLVSDYSERRLVRRKLWGSLFMVLLGMAMLVVAFSVLVVSFG